VEQRSQRKALIVYSGVPFALVGGIFALGVAKMSLSLSALIGLMAVTGIAVFNKLVRSSLREAARKKSRAESGSDSDNQESASTSIMYSPGRDGRIYTNAFVDRVRRRSPTPNCGHWNWRLIHFNVANTGHTAPVASCV
jgi:hypothetical protein